jgi:hypothetical protein
MLLCRYSKIIQIHTLKNLELGLQQLNPTIIQMDPPTKHHQIIKKSEYH